MVQSVGLGGVKAGVQRGQESEGLLVTLASLEHYMSIVGNSHRSTFPGTCVNDLEARRRVSIPPRENYLPEYRRVDLCTLTHLTLVTNLWVSPVLAGIILTSPWDTWPIGD